MIKGEHPTWKLPGRRVNKFVKRYMNEHKNPAGADDDASVVDYKVEKKSSSSKFLSPLRSIRRMVSSKSKKKGLSSTEDLLDITFEAPPSPGVEAAPEPVATPVVEKEVHPVEETQEQEAKSEPIVVAVEKEKLDKEIAYETDNDKVNDKVDSSNDCCTACSIM